MKLTLPGSFHIVAARLLVACMVAASLALLGAPEPARAASYTVTKTADTDDGACNRDCSLREAIAAANARRSHDTIRLPAGTYALTLGELAIASDLRLRGAGAAATIVDGGGSARVLAILSGDVRIDDLTIRNGGANEGGGVENFGRLRLQSVAIRGNGAGEDGAGIRNSGQLTIDDSVVADNRAETGGGIFNRGELTMTGGTISGNLARYGAGIRNSGTLRLRHVTIASNSAGDATVSGGGGGIFNEDTGTLDLRDVVLQENTAARTTAEQSAGGGILNAGRATLLRASIRTSTGDLGGGIRNLGRLTARASEVSGSNGGYGAGISNAGELELVDSVVVGGEAFFVGGGIFNAGVLRLIRSAIHDNASSEDGGGLYNTGTASLTDSEVHTNLAVDGSGGGIASIGTLTMRGGAVRDNTSRGLSRGGGGIDSRGTLTLRDLRISGNRTNEFGGGIYSSGRADLAGVIVENNTADLEHDRSGDGGGIYSSGRLALVRGAVVGNAGVSGGGLFNAGTGGATVTNSTFSGNSAAELGGAVANAGGALSLNNVTITLNRADSDADESGTGGGIFNRRVDGVSGAIKLKNTILAGNRDLTGDGPDCWGAIGTLGHNLIQNPFNCTFAGDSASDIVGPGALLGPLADNGGGTLTHALLGGSPAIDAVPLAACADDSGAPIAIDQRGVHRPRGPACDIGAYER